jgi:radical SAM protein with 4Fe4S-binding SPASM domain
MTPEAETPNVNDTVKAPFFLCYVETTRRCNLECPYCMTRREGADPSAQLSGDQIKTLVLDELAAARPGAAVAFSGGETLLREDALDLIAHGASRGLSTFLNTNGLALTEELLPRLREAAQDRLVVVLPFNSVEEAPQRWTRDDTADTVMRAADRCEKAGVEHFFLVTVSAKTAESIGRTMTYLKRRQTPVLRAPFVPRGAGSCFPELLLKREEMEKLVHPALSGNHLSYISFTPFFASPEALAKVWQSKGVRIAGLGCQAGRSFAAVSVDGDISPCVQLLDSSATCGNVTRDKLSEVLNTHPVFEQLRKRDAYQGKCGRCRYRMSCGGCRALALYGGDGLFSEDPTCFFDPTTPDDVSPLEEEQTRGVQRFLEFIKYNEPWNTLF